MRLSVRRPDGEDSEVRMGSPHRSAATGPTGGRPDQEPGNGTPGHGAAAPGVVIVMGVAGTGKTTVGGLLAEALGVPYAEADAFHPPANVAKMSSGRPLDDADREPWLDAIGAWAGERERSGGVVSCSALKRAYRDRLRAAAPGVFFVHLTGDRSLIAQRMEQRRDHFMPPALLDSQFATLEPLQPDEEGTAVQVCEDPDTVTRRALDAFRERAAAGGEPVHGGVPAAQPARTADTP